MKAQFPQSIDFNQMLVFSVFGHLLILTFVLFSPKPPLAVKAVVPAFMVSLVESPSGNKSAVKKNLVRKSKASIKKSEPRISKSADKKNVVKKKTAPVKKTSQPDKIIAALNKLDKKAAAVVPAKKMFEDLEQLALLERPKKQIAKLKIEKPVLEETFRDLEKLKDKKVKTKKDVPPTPKLESLLEGFEDIKMQKVLEQEKKGKPLDEEEIVEPAVKKRNLLKELEKLAKLDSIVKKVDEDKTPDTEVADIESKAYDSVLAKFESLAVESSRVKVEVTSARIDGSKFQSKLRSLPDSPEKVDSKSEDESYVYSDREGTPGADIQSLYAGMVQERIYRNWRDPLAERHSKEAIISFHIFAKGNIDKPFIKQSSGVEALDTLAVRAVLDSVPFPHFPKELKMSNLFLSIYFKYVPKDE
ncbi:MAG: TonB family protein [Nitrospinales bacterium]|jgi:TonB family protein